MMIRNTFGAGAVVALLLTAGAAQAASLVVVEARGIGLKPGTSIDSTKPLVLKQGQHVVAKDKHPGNVLNSAMKAVGVDQNLGEVIGVIPELFV